MKITTYQNDSLTTVDAVLTANYAIYYENRELWEAKGATSSSRNPTAKPPPSSCSGMRGPRKIYSNVDSKIVQNNGRDNASSAKVSESDEEFKDWRFRRMKGGRMEVEMKQSADSAATDSSCARFSASDSRLLRQPVRRPDARIREGR